MKYCLKISIIVLVAVGLIASVHSCKKEKESTIPVLNTVIVSGITLTGAVSGGNVTSDGGAAVTARGVCWGSTANPTIAGSKTTDGTGTGTFTSSLTGLTPSTLYYVKAYASNSVGTAYGNEVTFSTNSIAGPTLTTSEIIGITSSEAVSGGEITNDGGASITARGVCWATTENPTTSNNISPASVPTGTGIFICNIIGLTPGTIYHLKAYATNSSGTAYGNELTFTTLAGVPTVTTTEVSAPTQTTLTTGGDVTANGGVNVTARGVCYGTVANPTISGAHTIDGSGDGPFTSTLTGLSPGTLYYIRAYATNSIGTSYGNEINSTTTPSSALAAPINISAGSGDSWIILKWYAVTNTTAYNVYWSTSPGVSKTNFTGKISDIITTSYTHTSLTKGVTYYYIVTAKTGTEESTESSEARATIPLLFSTSSMTHQGEKQYYTVTVSSGQRLFVKAGINYPLAQDYFLYVKFGSYPTETDYDVKSETGMDEIVSVMNTQSGIYYIMVYASRYDSFYDVNYSIIAVTSTYVLTVGSTNELSLTHQGEKRFFEVTIPPDQKLFVALHVNYALAQDYFLYVKYGSIPTLTDYDVKSETGDDELIQIMNTQSGTYYIMVYASRYDSFYDTNYSITAFQ